MFLKRKVSIEELWSIKEIIIWARRHAYTPISLIFNSEKALVDKTNLNSDINTFSTYTKSIDLHKWLSETNKSNEKNNCDESDEEIDIISETKPSGMEKKYTFFFC